MVKIAALLTGPNDGNLLSPQVITPIPSSRMHCLALIVVVAWYVEAFRFVELTGGSNQEITADLVRRCELRLFSSTHSHSSLPFEGFVVPVGCFNCGMEPSILVQSVCLGDVDQVVLLCQWRRRADRLQLTSISSCPG